MTLIYHNHFNAYTLVVATLLVAGVLLRACYIKRSATRKGHRESIKQDVKDYGSINQNVKDREPINDSIKLSNDNSALVSDKEDHQTDRQSLL